MTHSGGVVTRTWRSFDGSRDGLEVAGVQRTVLLGCVDGNPAVREKGDGGNKVHPRIPEPAYLPDLPTRAAAISGYLARTSSDPDLRRGPVLRQKLVDEVLRTNDLLPARAGQDGDRGPGRPAPAKLTHSHVRPGDQHWSESAALTVFQAFP